MDDIFDDILDLEGDFYTEGYNQGWADGVTSGKVEGRCLGMERGFDKFFEAGRLHGKSLVWASRLPTKDNNDNTSTKDNQQSLPPLARSHRLEKNITVLHDLMEPDTLPTQNTDETVEDVDDRIRKAQGKARIIERTIGEVSNKGMSGDVSRGPAGKNENIEDARGINISALITS